MSQPMDQSEIGYYRFASRSKGWQSWLTSFLFHGLILAVIAILLYQIPKGAARDDIATGGIVLVNADLEANEKPYLEKDDVESPDATDAAAAAAAGAVAATEQTMSLDDLPDLPGLDAADDAKAKATQAQQAVPGAGDLAVPTTQNGGGKIGQKPVGFSGVKGVGSRFVYVVDRSASMNEKGLMKAAKAELKESLSSLTELQQFQVVFYNDHPLAFNPNGGPPKLFFGTEENIALALDFVERTTPDGATVHLEALEQALGLGADVVFLLTDADDGLTRDELAAIDRANRAAASINVIVFGPTAQPTAANLSFNRLTKENRGQFVYKPLTAIRRP